MYYIFDQSNPSLIFMYKLANLQIQNKVNSKTLENIFLSKTHMQEQNSMVKQQLIEQVKQLQNKQKMIEMYMNYEYPQKQKNMLRWWEDLIQQIIKKKRQIYITFKDLQQIATIHNMKPIPLKPILKELHTKHIFLREEELKYSMPVKKQSAWYSNMLSYVWGKDQENQNAFSFDANQKIISSRIKQLKKVQLQEYLNEQFQIQHSRFVADLIKSCKAKLQIDSTSIQLLLEDMNKEKIIILDETDPNNKIVIYCSDKSKIRHNQFVQVERIKCVLKQNIAKFEERIELSSQKILNLRQKAKQALNNNDINRAKIIAKNLKKQQEFRDNINVRKVAIQQQYDQIQVNSLNKSSFDLLQDAQRVFDDFSIDPSKVEQILEKNHEAKMKNQQTNMKFSQLSQQDDLGDDAMDMLHELQQEISNNKKKMVEQKSVSVQLKPVPLNNNTNQNQAQEKQNYIQLN